MGKVSVNRKKSLQMLPDKDFRFSFCIVSIHATLNGEKFLMYRNDKPNSVRTNRPLLEALADENNKASNMFCTLPIEQDRQVLIDNRVKLIIGQKV